MSQILPKENSILNYRIIGFSFAPVPGVSKYKIEVALGNFFSPDSFKRNIIYSSYCKNNKIIAEVPSFGKQYTWRIICKDNTSGDSKIEGLHHFSTSIISDVDTAVTRLRVLQQALKYEDAYVFLDGNRALYDMHGQPVWYLPDIDGHITEKSRLRDMKCTSRGTITFLYEEIGAYEIDYNGHILWKAPNNGSVSGGNSESYHHEFTRLDNGHYMILGIEPEVWNQHLPSATDSSFMIFHDDKVKRDTTGGVKYVTMPFGTIIEYDEKGNVVWSWKSSDYFKRSDIYYHYSHGKPEIAAHENSLYFDERAGVIYVGFRNISRILKVKYPEGTVLSAYGEVYKPEGKEEGNGLFCRQHSVRHSEDGYLYLYNNNSCVHGESMPRVLKLEEPAGNGPLKKIWEYECTVEGVIGEQQPSYQFPVGGNVLELPGHSLFVNMSGAYSKVFILSKDKKILWSAIPEKWDATDKKWKMVYQYRAGIITNRKDLEKLVWNIEAKE